MVEFIRHLFGFCGDGHPSLLMLFTVTPFIVFKNYVVSFFKMLILILKNHLR
jgi:hypothetical protein